MFHLCFAMFVLFKQYPAKTTRSTSRIAVKLPPHYYSIVPMSIFAEWGLVKANTRRGVFRVKI
jgi:hypothetical protein